MKQTKKIVSWLLAIAIIVSMLPATVLTAAASSAYGVLMQPTLNGYLNGNASGNVAVVRENVYYVPSTGEKSATEPSGVRGYWQPDHLVIYSANGTVSEWPITYWKIGSFNAAGYAVVENFSEKWGVINASGELVISCQYENISCLTEDGYAIGWSSSGCYLLDLNQGTALQLSLEEKEIWSGYNDGYFLTREYDEQAEAYSYSYLDQQGNNVLNGTYSYAIGFSNGYAVVKTVGADVYQIINSSGTAVGTLDSAYTSAGSFSAEGLMAVYNSNDEYGYIDTTGAVKITPQYGYANDFCNGYAVVYDSNYKLGLIDTSGNVVIPFGTYDRLTNVSDTGILWATVGDETYVLTAAEETAISLSISIAKSEVTVVAGSSATPRVLLSPTSASVTWTSSNTNVATVSSNGTVTGVAEGTALITGTATYGEREQKAYYQVTVTPATSVKFAQSSISLLTGDTTTLVYTFRPSNATVTLHSSNTSVVTVSGNQLTAVGPGTAIITVSAAANGVTKTDTCTVIVKAAAIDDDDVFVKQLVPGSTCTLASATMMLRRRAILDGISDWESITETAVRRSAWTSRGLLNSFTYRGMYVTTSVDVNISSMSVAEKKAYFVQQLTNHPEGIVIYKKGKNVNEQYHAVLLTDYDEATDTFYCADPDPTSSKGRIPLANSTIQGTTQNEVLSVISDVWIIKSDSNEKQLTSSKISTHCPVDMSITIGSEILDSSTVSDTAQNSYAMMSVSGTDDEKSVEVTITGDYAITQDMSVELYGTGVGAMTFEVTHYFSDNTTETYTFENVPLTDTSVGTAAGFYPQSTVLLFMIDTVQETEEVWAADPNETVTEPFDRPYWGEIDDNSINSSRPTYSGASTYAVSTANTDNGTLTVNPSSATKNSTVTITVTPDKDYELTSLTVTDANGNRVSVKQAGDNKFTFTMPASKVTVSASFSKVVKPLPFTDVSANDYFFDAVAWAVENGVTYGNTATTFGVGVTCNRADAVTFIWRAYGCPAPKSSENPFTDVADSAYYADAVLWAVENGITVGTSATTFSPLESCRREHIVTFLYRAAGSPTVSHSSGFSDVADSAYYANAVTWAAENDITVGAGSANTFGPTQNCFREQIVTFLYRNLAE